MKLKLDDYIELKTYYAHTYGKFIEFIEEHSEKTEYYLNKIDLTLIKNVIKNFEIFTNEEQEFIFDMIYYSICWHDIGKINPFMQCKMNNPKFKQYTQYSSNHSLISAFILHQIFYEEMNKNNFKHKKELYFIMLRFLFVVSKHHSNLTNFKENELEFSERYAFLSNLANLYDMPEYFINYKKRIQKINIDVKDLKKLWNEEFCLTMYDLISIVYSMIVFCDRYATDTYMNEKFTEIDDNGNAINNLIKNYRNSNRFTSIRKYEKNKPSIPITINDLRNEMFLESEKTLEKNWNKQIYYLEMPVGSGKTNCAINLVTKIIEHNPSINNIIYTLPFNSIASQVFDEFVKYAGEDSVNLSNSVTPMAHIPKNYSLLDEEFWHDTLQNNMFMNYHINILSHVKLFSILFSCNLKDKILLNRLMNSVIILDEIQCYKNSIWRHMILMLKYYAKLFNIKFIIMSATLPNLSKLTNDVNDDGYVNLIQNPSKYFSNILFKNRVKYIYDWIKLPFNEVEDKIIEMYKNEPNKKYALEFIKKKSAYEFYEKHKDLPNLYLVTSDTNKIEKAEIIEKIKNSESIFVVMTQVFEAGVDVSFQVGFKDVSILESEEQFSGRICRNGEGIGYLYFFNKDDERAIYRNDERINFSIKEQKYRDIFENKQFSLYYDDLLELNMKNTQKQNTNNIEIFYSDCILSNFKNIDKLFRLIDKQDTTTVIIDAECFDKKHNEYLTSENLMKQYKNLIKNFKNKSISYAEYQVRLSDITSKLSLFSRNVFDYELRELLETGYEKDEFLSTEYYVYLKKV